MIECSHCTDGRMVVVDDGGSHEEMCWACGGSGHVSYHDTIPAPAWPEERTDVDLLPGGW